MLADCLEAIIGAVCIDGGFEAAKNLVYRLLQDVIKSLVKEESGYHNIHGVRICFLYKMASTLSES